MRCEIFNCDRVHGNRCCAECEQKRRCPNPCLNHPDKCGLVKTDKLKDMIAKAGIRTVRQPFVDRLMKTGIQSGEFRPKGLFICRDKARMYIGIDNSTGCAWTEEFESKEECVKWLAGEETR